MIRRTEPSFLVVMLSREIRLRRAAEKQDEMAIAANLQR
jgi:hypothetical protein